MEYGFFQSKKHEDTRVTHYKILKKENGLMFIHADNHFVSLRELVAYYSGNVI